MDSLHRPNGSLAGSGALIGLTADDAGWTYSGLRVVDVAPGEPISYDTGPTEAVVLPLSAQQLTVEADGTRFSVEGRRSVFARVTDFAYVGRDTTVTIVSETGGQVALPSAHCDDRLPPRYGAAEDVAVEIRGGGQATRQITNFLSPEAWDHASKLMCVEVYTPDGNWSSYPPHKHDDSPECEVNNEEIYYFRIGEAGTADYTETGFGMHRLYTTDGEIDENVAVRDGDVFLIPRGYHGPCIAAPGYDMYYLNVLAGPGGERSMAFCDDPDHHWIRDTWSDDDLDPRCPWSQRRGD
ncbi:MAG: 5-deoxy-glucuronate isomerase, partial [Acidimicrobiia bacterium]|nr:5-deoxy-glucuronate isomerase [Acidimicrobiia bacterium]